MLAPIKHNPAGFAKSDACHNDKVQWPTAPPQSGHPTPARMPPGCDPGRICCPDVKPHGRWGTLPFSMPATPILLHVRAGPRDRHRRARSRPSFLITARQQDRVQQQPGVRPTRPFTSCLAAAFPPRYCPACGLFWITSRAINDGSWRNSANMYVIRVFPLKAATRRT